MCFIEIILLLELLLSLLLTASPLIMTGMVRHQQGDLPGGQQRPSPCSAAMPPADPPATGGVLRGKLSCGGHTDENGYVVIPKVKSYTILIKSIILSLIH